MTESEWLASSDPAAMLECLQNQESPPTPGCAKGPSDRKLRLFAVAVEREWWGDSKARNEKSLRIMEAVADGRLPVERSDDVVFSYATPRNAVDLAAECVRIHDSKGDPPRWSNLLRDIFGNPWKPVMTDYYVPIIHDGNISTPQIPIRHYWLMEPRVQRLAQAIYDERAFDRMPVLADALEEAGCREEELLRHLRGEEVCWCCRASFPAGSADLCSVCCHGQETLGRATGWSPLRGPHVRGCWALDLILGKE